MRAALLAILVLCTPTLAFWSTGHMIITKIAENELERDHPELLKFIKDDVAVLEQYSKEKEHGFVESSSWADDNKGVAWMAFNEWHFVDTAVVEEGWEGEVDLNPENATWALSQTVRTL